MYSFFWVTIIILFSVSIKRFLQFSSSMELCVLSIWVMEWPGLSCLLVTGVICYVYNSGLEQSSCWVSCCFPSFLSSCSSSFSSSRFTLHISCVSSWIIYIMLLKFALTSYTPFFRLSLYLLHFLLRYAREGDVLCWVSVHQLLRPLR